MEADIRRLVEQADELAKDRVTRNAEIKALREALDTIANKTTGVGAMFEQIRDIAREALAQPSVLASVPPDRKGSR